MSEQTNNAEELERFSTHNRREILFYLNQLINDSERISVIFNGGSDTVLSMLLHVDDGTDQLIFDWGGSEESNAKLLRSERNFFVCAPHGVKNHFVVGKVQETTFQKRRAFVTKIPDRYTRLQRREFFRLVLPITRRLPCTVTLADGKTMQLTVVDISIGGIGAEFPEDANPFEIKQKLLKSKLELKGVGILEVDLIICNNHPVQRGDKQFNRIGCNFIKISHGVENQLQRFITDVQREERARLGG
jgi:c-di-GMP-binding flagellar brake protein YcgR